MQSIKHIQYQTQAGLTVRRASSPQPYQTTIAQLVERLDEHRGVLLASSFEYPGRYTRWDIGFVNPPLAITANAARVKIEALNKRGQVLLPEVFAALQANSDIETLQHDAHSITAVIKASTVEFNEEQRSRKPSVFSLLRNIVALFYSDTDAYLGLYGAFGYDLGFQFEDVQRFQSRSESDRNMVLYLPDQIFVADHRTEIALSYDYDFVCHGWDSTRRSETTGGYRRSGSTVPYIQAAPPPKNCDHMPGEYAATVSLALDEFRQGNLFEVVPGQVFFEACPDKPSQIFRRLQATNPAPYGALINLGESEYLVAASPEMFVRVEGRQIETCPISGTIRRGEDAIADAEQIRTLLNSSKDESELSMCTDVDRNDKARVCEPGSVKVIGRRQIEMYSRLIHTVDHVTGTLAAGFDALDGFLAHTWAVTVTGAPKHAAMQFIEQQEKSPRHWYGGAMGQIGFNGNLNTGLTLRTMRIKDGIAEVRAGATLLIDSDPEAEEAETHLKASALLDAIRGRQVEVAPLLKSGAMAGYQPLQERTLQALMIDHQDSFVHSLGAYFRLLGISVTTMRPAMARRHLRDNRVDMVILSPGPGRPADFQVHDSIDMCVEKAIPVFGVCLGLQGLVEYFGGSLGVLDYPMHGKESLIRHRGGMLFEGIDSPFRAGRYHSLYAAQLPACLSAIASSDDNIVMAIEHKSKPIIAVQFHPESIMSLSRQNGLRLIANVVKFVSSSHSSRRTG